MQKNCSQVFGAFDKANNLVSKRKQKSVMGLNCCLKEYFKKRKGEKKTQHDFMWDVCVSLRPEVSHFGWKDDFGRIH